MEILPFHSTRGCLSFLVIDHESHKAALIDPTEEIPDATYLSTLSEHGARLEYLIETHTHADHISSAPRLRELTGAQIMRHLHAPSKQKDTTLVGGESLSLGSVSLEILATPGHTDESISIVVPGAVFTGDALLIGGTGRTDFQAGSSEALYESLHMALAVLPDDTVVYPAHDYKGRTSSTLGQERLTNPRLTLSREAFIETMNAHHPSTPELFTVAIERNSQ